MTLQVEVLQCAPELSPWGDWGQAAMMAFAYRDPLSGEAVTVEQAVRRPVGGRVDAVARGS